MERANLRDLAAWSLSQDDRTFVEGLRRKQAAGEDLTADDDMRLQVIWRVGRPKVHGEAAERRLKPDQPIEAIWADLDKFVPPK